MPNPRGQMASAVVNGKIHLIEGNIGGTHTNLHNVYDPATDTWSTAAPLPTTRTNMRAVAADGKIYCP